MARWSKIYFALAKPFFVTLALAACLPDAAAACQLTISGSQPALSNSAPVDCISITNATVAGDFNNTGSVLQNGIIVIGSTLQGVLLNLGPLAGGNVQTLAGGISADAKSSMGGGAVIGIGMIAVPNFSGGISTAATINAGNGVYVDRTNNFAGGIVNSGQITAGNGLSISNISNFSGGVANTGQLDTTNYGISLLSIADFQGGVFNSGSISSSGVNRDGIGFYAGSYAGGITNTGKITAAGAGISLGDLICVCIPPPLNFSGGIFNSGTIQGGFAGIAIVDPTTFSGTIVNAGSISGVTGLVLFYNGPGGVSVLNSGTITGTGGTAITFGVPGVLTLTATSVINGRVLGNGGVLQLGGSSSGTFDVSALGTQYLNFASLNKVDGSTWTLSGSGAFSGPVTVNSGALVLNGSLPSAPVVVNAGATFGGSGTVGGTTVNGGTLVTVGTLQVQGNLTFTSSANYLVAVSSGNTGRTDVTGTAALNGNVQVSSQDNSYKFNSPLEIISSSGLNGTHFNSVSAPVGISPSLIYSGGDVFLNLVSSLGQLGAVNQRAVGTALDSALNSNQPNAFGSIFGGNVLFNLTQLSGESATASQQTTFYAMSQFMNLLTDPFMERGGGINGATAPNGYAEGTDQANAYAANKQLAAERDAYAMFTKAPLTNGYQPRWSVWASGFGGSQTTNGNAMVGSNDTRSSVFGTAVGADYLLSPRTIAGFALAGGGTNFSVNNLGSGRSDLFQAGAYVRHTNGAAYVTGALAYGWQDITTDRIVSVAGLDHLRAQFNANAYSGRVEGGYRFVAPWVGGVGITPYAAGQFVTFAVPAYMEQAIFGANTFALGYNATSVTDGRSELGVRSDKSFAMQNGILTLRGRLGWAHDFDPNRNLSATFQTLPGATFVVNGARHAADSALTTASAEWKWIKGWSAAATFEGEFSGVTSSYAGKGVVRYVW